MKKYLKVVAIIFFCVSLVISSSGCLSDDGPKTETINSIADLSEDGSYYSKDDIANYIKTYNHLPPNYITKSEARKLGWSGGPLEKYAPGKRIGGDRFTNRQKVLPAGEYYECDITDNDSNTRGAKRIVYSTDGRVYYTEDHYKTFVELNK